tara:strand:+ start:15118 stop:17556 length:2439 start_codon:yes stop_codon:yes gene_type:complete
VPAYADIAFPTAVRQLFTYQVPEKYSDKIEPGIRVWVPLRNHFAIGMVVGIHNRKPDFKTRPIRDVLDQKPVLNENQLALTDWIHQFYFCSWGEVIQAAQPAGMNFISEKYVRINEETVRESLDPDQVEVLDAIKEYETLTLNEAKKRWNGTRLNKVFKGLLKQGVLEIWELPEQQVEIKKERQWKWAESITSDAVQQFLDNENGTLNKWQSALAALKEAGLPKRESELSDLDIFNSYTKKKLQDAGWITYDEVEVRVTIPGLQYDPESIKILNEAQKEVFAPIKESIEQEEFANYLLYGITGSGKTEVYIHALKKVREMGKGGIVLVPEIALTPQTVARFYRIFGEEVAVLHSRMTSRERLQAWNELKEGKKKIAIGPRSAVFAPVKDPGLIILDEEHDHSYKQVDPAPRYHAREVAIMRANLEKAVVIMGSATPSMQALNMAAKGKCVLLKLNKRHAEARLPEVEILDLKQYEHAMRGELSVPLFGAIEDALKNKEQVILLYNRRGFASYLQCGACGHIPQSPECSVTLTYHKRKNLLMCHYSGYSRRADTHCEICGSPNMIEKGSGTQKVEEQLEELFPKAKVIRFDRDSTTRKGAHQRILNTFGEGGADIMIGTQLVAKGLDFPNVTVVGVIDADTEQAFPSFQSTERTYQLLSQVSGRSGRGSKPGKVFIQTRQPENAAIQFAKEHDHEGFSKQEMGFRKPLNYPPYSRLIKFVLKGKEEMQVSASAHLLRKCIHRVVPDLDVLGPSAAAISWMNRNYFWEVTLKIDPERGGKYIEAVLNKVMELYDMESKKIKGSIRVNINVDAIR